MVPAAAEGETCTSTLRAKRNVNMAEEEDNASREKACSCYYRYDRCSGWVFAGRRRCLSTLKGNISDEVISDSTQ